MNPNQFYALPPVAADPQTAADGRRLRQVFPDRALLPRRRPARRPPARVHTDRLRECRSSSRKTCSEIFERWAKHMFRDVMGIELTEPLRRMPWIEAMEKYGFGQTRPALRHGVRGDHRPRQGARLPAYSTRPNTSPDSPPRAAPRTPASRSTPLTEFVKRQQIGAKGLIWIRVAEDGVKSSIDKFYSPRGGPRHGRALRRCGRGHGLHPLRQEVQNADAAVRPAPRSGPAAGAARPEEVRAALGWWTSRSSSGTTRRSVTTPYTTPSPRPSPRTCNTSTATRPRTRQRLRLRLQRHGDRRRFDPYPRLEVAGRRCSKCWASRPNRRSSASGS